MLDVETLGVLTPKSVEIDELVAGEVGFIVANKKLFLIPRSVTPSQTMRAPPLSLARL